MPFFRNSLIRLIEDSHIKNSRQIFSAVFLRSFNILMLNMKLEELNDFFQTYLIK